MAECLNKKKLLEWVPKLIETAEKELIIISPYIQISEKIFALLVDAEKRGVETTLIYKEGELSDKERKRFYEIENLNLLFHPNLHSKCMYNEKYFLLTSMNLYEYSQKHNREMGVLFRRTDEDSTGWNDYRSGQDDESIFQDAIEEIQSILNSSEFEKESFETKPSVSRWALSNPKKIWRRKIVNFTISFRRTKSSLFFRKGRNGFAVAITLWTVLIW